VDGNAIKSEHLIELGKVAPEAAVSQLIEHAITAGASDLFLNAGDRHFTIQMRQLGIVRPLSVMPADQGRRCLGHIKARAGMDTTEKRRPLDGRWIFDLRDGAPAPKLEAAEGGRSKHSIDLRVNIIPTLHGEDATIRLLPHDHSHFVLEDLGMTNGQLEQYRQIFQSPSGLVLITGPTGSGKTATLYSTLLRLNDGSRKICTIEDPIEYAVEGLHQSQVNAAIDLTFSELLRAVLRQSPDVIMIGEIRDEETAQIAVHAANSGVLVFATLHAPAAPAAIQSIRSLGVRPHFLASSLRGVIAQRLVRTLCPQCRVALDLGAAPHMFNEVRPWLTADQGRALHAAAGCNACGMSGYAGRAGVFEVMPISPALRDLIAEARGSRELRARAVEDGMLQFRQAALLKVACGQTSTEEVFRVIPTEHLLLED
jgi:type II secretory ATPase GspE/PulE/Tfp pilus assembly ATPase PilB-like protein